ncbi:Replication initiator protein A [Gemmata obscuriglobus]|uniref:Replication protein A n=1 Tax=Gemmata obscuriglobus TaxID=114 RepID=A0A2Z3H968_9BACT|nr:replication initiator protein A [Gemmata obscuriglobus]AWM40166.1 replication protein A [Gemmata obscuriglobus]QEG26651.1 Replication initiator protein A [Gemmata obscuriglobus]VTS02241.1 Plasmid replication initiator protein OS=Sphingobium sp. C100 GN=C100_20535 PE=4 SV=1: RPA [Gemmata obscuriglobus UQM 2246]
MSKRHHPKGDHQPDLFAGTFADIPIRDQRDTMERPFFSLSKKPRLAPIEYQVGDVWVEVTANPKFGMASIWDADILIWASTQVTEALDRGHAPSRVIHFHPYNLLKSVRRSVGGDHYRRLREALNRLTHTAVSTNIRVQGKKKSASFHWLESWTEEVNEATGETAHMTMTLPDWLYTGIVAKGGVLTIHEDYFLLTGGIERWLYRVARKHAGTQPAGWTFTMRQLYAKSGSAARFSDFALDVRKVVEADSLPEYALAVHRTAEDEVVTFLPRCHLPPADPRFQPPRARHRHAKATIAEPALTLAQAVTAE